MSKSQSDSGAAKTVIMTSDTSMTPGPRWCGVCITQYGLTLQRLTSCLCVNGSPAIGARIGSRHSLAKWLLHKKGCWCLGASHCLCGHGNENNCTNGRQLRGRPFEGKNVVVIQYLLVLNTALLNQGKQRSGRIKRRDKPFLTLIGNF